MSADPTSAITIAIGAVLMSLIAMVGAITLVLPARRLEALLLPLVALAAGSLLGGALFHMLPEGFSQLLPRRGALWIGAGFSTFLVLEQSVHWHHSHRKPTQRSGVAVQPMALLILLGAQKRQPVCSASGLTVSLLCGGDPWHCASPTSWWATASPPTAGCWWPISWR